MHGPVNAEHPKELLEILGNMKVAAFRAAPDSTLLAINQAGAELLGAASPAEVLGRRFADFYADTRERAIILKELATSGRAMGVRFRLRRLDGELVWVETNLMARRDPAGRVVSLEGFGRAVSELVAAEDEARRLNRFLQLIVEGANVLLTVVRLDGEVRIWNRKAAEITGYSQEEVVGHNQVWSWLFPDPGYRDGLRDTGRAVLRGEEVEDLETTIVTRNGEPRIIIWNSRLIAGDDEGSGSWLALGRDITLEKGLQRRLQEQEVQQRAELERLVRERTEELERANSELKLLDQMKARFLANISHELRTPLVSGLGYVNLILEGGMGPVNKKVRKGLGISQQNLQRLTALIDDLLAFTKDGTGARPLSQQSFDLAVLIDECLLDLQGHLRAAARVRTELDPQLPPVHADREQIRRVITNLLTNAEKFTGEDALIEVLARPAGELVEVEVRDNGIGIPAEECALVFERLYRSTRTDPSVYRGTGIGLYLVREILRAHGCNVRAVPRPERGTSIIFTLPCAAGTGGPPAVPLASDSESGRSHD